MLLSAKHFKVIIVKTVRVLKLACVAAGSYGSFRGTHSIVLDNHKCSFWLAHDFVCFKMFLDQQTLLFSDEASTQCTLGCHKDALITIYQFSSHKLAKGLNLYKNGGRGSGHSCFTSSLSHNGNICKPKVFLCEIMI